MCLCVCACVCVCACIDIATHNHIARSAQYLSILFSQFPISRLSLFLSHCVLCARPWYTCVLPPLVPLSSPPLCALRHYFLFSFYPDYLTRKIHGRAHSHTGVRALSGRHRRTPLPCEGKKERNSDDTHAHAIRGSGAIRSKHRIATANSCEVLECDIFLRRYTSAASTQIVTFACFYIRSPGIYWATYAMAMAIANICLCILNICALRVLSIPYAGIFSTSSSSWRFGRASVCVC